MASDPREPQNVIPSPVIGRPWGIPIRLHWTIVLLLLAPVLPLWPESTPGPAARFAVVLALALCVLVHEAAHAVTARLLRIPPLEVILYPFGGVTRFARPLLPGPAEALVAVSGPLANLALAGALELAAVLAGGWPAVHALAWANALLGFGNLLPAWPLDGGRVVRSVLVRWLTPERATRLVGLSGQLMGLLAVVEGFRGRPLWTVPGLILFLAASSELQRLSLEALAGRLKVGDAMLPRPLLVPVEVTVAEAREISRSGPGREILLVEGDRPTAYLPAARLWAEPVDLEEAAAAMAEPVGPPLRPEMEMERAADAIQSSGARVAPVVDAEGRVMGVVTLGALRRAHDLAERLAARAAGGGSSAP